MIAWRTSIYPTRRWLIALGLSLVLSIGNIFQPAMLPVVLSLDACVLLVGSLDLVLFWWTTSTGITTNRRHVRTGSIGVSIDSLITVHNRTSVRLVGDLKEDSPPGLKVIPDTHPIQVDPAKQIEIRQQLLPTQRGKLKLDHIHLRLLSPLRFWNRIQRVPCSSEINVYPDMKQMADYAMLARTNRLSLIGVRKTRRIGQDSDFERLRDYTRDDNYRHIDWRSTARRKRLTVRQFQTDQSQRIMLLLDCGRMMTGRCGELTMLDRALNASLMMAYVALQQGDAVGMLCFSDRVESYLPPRSGASQMNRLLQASFDRFPRMVESRYDLAFLYLQNHLKRRSLVGLVTNVIDEVNAASVVDYLGNLSTSHLPLGIFLRDPALTGTVDKLASSSRESDEPENQTKPADWFRGAAAVDIMRWRSEVIRDLRHRGALCIDSTPDDLTAPMINQYLEVKAKHLL